MSYEKSNIIPLQLPRNCNYVDLKDYLVAARKNNDHFLFEVNKIKSLEECNRVWEELESKSTMRMMIIDKCIQETTNDLNNINKELDNTQQSLPTPSTSLQQQQRSLKNKLNLLNMEKEVEQVMSDHAVKVFHKVCK
eukprot:gene4181-5232_t